MCRIRCNWRMLLLCWEKKLHNETVIHMSFKASHFCDHLSSMLTTKTLFIVSHIIKAAVIFSDVISALPLQWRHNGRDGVSNHRRLHIFCSNIGSGTDQRKHQNVTGLCAGNSPVTSNAVTSHLMTSHESLALYAGNISWESIGNWWVTRSMIPQIKGP